jgi:hypothetical protein
MPDIFRAMRFGLAVLAVGAILTGGTSLSNAATGSVRIVITRANFIFGGGSGTLHFQGKRYALRVGGISIGPIGAARADLVGRAYNLRTAASIRGIYSAVGGDAPVAAEAGLVPLRNWNGVVLKLRGRRGVNPSVDLTGMDVSLR